MRAKESGNGGDYADRAFAEFNEIMSGSQKDMLENISRANRGELFVLHFLATRQAEVLPSELSAALGASTARISALLGALEKKGQIARDIDKNNRRNILVTITQQGRSRAQAEMREMRERMTRVFREMGQEDAEAFIRLSRRFSQLVQKHMSREEEKARGRA